MYRGSLTREYTEPYFPPLLHRETTAAQLRFHDAFHKARLTFREIQLVDENAITSRVMRKAVRDICQKYWMEKAWVSTPSLYHAKPHAKTISAAAASLHRALTEVPGFVHGAILMASEETLYTNDLLGELEQLKAVAKLSLRQAAKPVDAITSTLRMRSCELRRYGCHSLVRKYRKQFFRWGSMPPSLAVLVPILRCE